jgi:pyruvate formate lyase activating enzyme
MSTERYRLKVATGREAELGTPLASGRVQCTACARRCQIGEGQIGLCGVRGVVAGRLYLLNYGRIIAGHVDPIEKKPVVHYRPGSKIFSIATTGCSWLCRFCQNSEISQRRKVEGVEASPERVVQLAEENECEGIAYTYNEPSIFMEYARDVGRIARRKGIFNIFVSNGYDTPESVGAMSEFLDCLTVDFKGSGETGFLRSVVRVPNAEPIFQTLLDVKQRTKIHIEITDLIVPGIGEDLESARRLSRWVLDNLGPDTPIHFLRFHPDYDMMDLPATPVKTLEKHYEVAKKQGLRYVYIGNVPGHPAENTYCPGCNALLVERTGYYIGRYSLDDRGRCATCGYQTPIVGPLGRSARENRFVSVIG